MMEKRKFFMEKLDHVRTVLLTEPRGYPCQNLNIILPASDSRAEFGYIIAEQNGIYPLFSGHNTICVVTALLETGQVAMKEPVTEFQLEAPGGLISVRARCAGGRVMEVSMTSLPSFVGKRDVVVEVPSLGEVKLDLVFGGMWFAIVSAEEVGLEICPEEGEKLARLGEMIKVAAREQSPVSHPTMEYEGPDILAWVSGSGLSRRNTVVMSNKVLDWARPETQTGMLDRSPCGSGTASVMALLHQKGELGLGQTFTHRSIIGTEFTGQQTATTSVDRYEAVIPVITGRGWLTARSDVIVEADDPLPTGYTVGDIW